MSDYPVIVVYDESYIIEDGNGDLQIIIADESDILSIEVSERGLQGIQGIQGDQGNAGFDGNRYSSGIAYGDNPINYGFSGVNAGDEFIDTYSGNFWDWNGSSWIYQFNSIGPAGMNGSDGAAGANGNDGAAGTPGNTWQDGYVYNSNPSAYGYSGVNQGDQFLDAYSGYVWQWQSGAWVYIMTIMGQNGMNGADGAPGMNGSDGMPGMNGNDGMAGSNGTNGNLWFVGYSYSNYPNYYGYYGTNAGDLFLDEYSSDIWRWNGGGWEYQFNNHGINGIDGAPGTNGTDGMNGSNGADGMNGTNGIDGVTGNKWYHGVVYGTYPNYYGYYGANYNDQFFDEYTGNTWWWDGGSWTFEICLKGADGANGMDGMSGSNGSDGMPGSNGMDGMNGTNGNTWQDGDSHGGDPSTYGFNGTNYGDQFLDISTGNIYQWYGYYWSYQMTLAWNGGTVSNDIEITDYTKGLILRASDGSRWRVTVDTSGALQTNAA